MKTTLPWLLQYLPIATTVLPEPESYDPKTMRMAQRVSYHQHVQAPKLVLSQYCFPCWDILRIENSSIGHSHTVSFLRWGEYLKDLVPKTKVNTCELTKAVIFLQKTFQGKTMELIPEPKNRNSTIFYQFSRMVIYEYIYMCMYTYMSI